MLGISSNMLGRPYVGVSSRRIPLVFAPANPASNELRINASSFSLAASLAIHASLVRSSAELIGDTPPYLAGSNKEGSSPDVISGGSSILVGAEGGGAGSQVPGSKSGGGGVYGGGSKPTGSPAP